LDPAGGAIAQVERAGLGDPLGRAVPAPALHRHEGDEAALARPDRFLRDDAGIGAAAERDADAGREPRLELNAQAADVQAGLELEHVRVGTGYGVEVENPSAEPLAGIGQEHEFGIVAGGYLVLLQEDAGGHAGPGS